MTLNGNWFFEINKDPILADQYANHIKQPLRSKDTCVFPGGGIQEISSFPTTYKNLTIDEFKDICKQLGIIQDKPKEWYVKITEDNLYYVNAYRNKIKPTYKVITASDIPNYSYLIYTAEGWGSSYKSSTKKEITHFEFIQICHDLGIPAKVKSEPIGSYLGDIEFLRNYPEILEHLKRNSSKNSLDGYIKQRYAVDEGFDWDKSKEGNDFWNTILADKKPEHYYTLYPKESKTKVEEKQVDNPSHYYCVITTDNIGYFKELFKGKDLLSDSRFHIGSSICNCKYVWNNNWKYSSAYIQVNFDQYLKLQKKLPVNDSNVTVDLSELIDYDHIPTMPVNGFDELKQVKQKIDIGEIPVKKRVLI